MGMYPKPYTLNPKPETLNPKPETLNPFSLSGRHGSAGAPKRFGRGVGPGPRLFPGYTTRFTLRGLGFGV